MSNIKLSVIIPARNEFPMITGTVYSIFHAFEVDFPRHEIEIIIVDNVSDDNRQHPKPGVKGTTSYLMPRGMFSNRYLRVIYDPIAGNHSARNKGALAARGKYLFFSDAHMAYRPGVFKLLMESVDESGGIVHCPIGWMGGYPPYTGSMGYSYTIKLGEEIKGTWNNYCLDKDKWFYIPALGHCSLMVLRKQFLEFGGYPGLRFTRQHIRAYGGGEFYLNMKWWLLGSSVAVHPQAHGYHLASERGYTYDHDDYIRNVLSISYSLDMLDWRERAYLNWLRRGKKAVLDRMMRETEEEFEEDRLFIKKRRRQTFNQMIVERPWARLNDKRLGRSKELLTVFHDTWLPLLDSTPAKEAYVQSKYQKGLEDFINANLSEFVYKRVKK